jgi:hypothetical protein
MGFHTKRFQLFSCAAYHGTESHKFQKIKEQGVSDDDQKADQLIHI